MHERPAGYSLYELIMTLGLLSIVLGLGLPSLAGLVADNALRAETDALFHAMHLARQESVIRRRVVTLCASVDGESCDPDNRWSDGWILFVNERRLGSDLRSAGEPLLRQHTVGDAAVIMSNRKAFSFRATELRATNGTLVVCDRADRIAPRAVVVSYTGRPRVAREDRRGKAYACAH